MASTSYTCERCLKDFTQKGHYQRHVSRKVPCKMGATVAALRASVPSVPATTPFRPLSLKLNKDLSKETRQAQGIFFTPKAARDSILDTLLALGVTTPSTILEPSFGSGEFLEDAHIRWPTAACVGCEQNETLYKAYAEKSTSGATLHLGDFMTWSSPQKADVILGNPPYLVIKDKNPQCMTGRPNLYVAFLYKCLTQHLADEGYLGFVLPTSLFNSSYYEPMRKYIAEHCTVCLLKELDVKYYQTEQNTMAIVLRKTPDSSRAYVLEKSGCF